MENTSIKKINTAGKIGYIISIILIVFTIASMVAIGICMVGAITIANNDINVKMATTINVNSTGNFLKKLNSLVFINGVEDLGTLTENDKTGIKLNDSDISEISVIEEEGGIVVNAKTNEVTISMKEIIMALVAVFIYIGAVTVTLYMLKALMKSLKNCETPFSEEVIKNMSKLAKSLVCLVILSTIAGGFKPLINTGTRFEFSINLGNVILVAIVYVLITVFKYGAKLQQESDETI